MIACQWKIFITGSGTLIILRREAFLLQPTALSTQDIHLVINMHKCGIHTCSSILHAIVELVTDVQVPCDLNSLELTLSVQGSTEDKLVKIAKM